MHGATVRLERGCATVFASGREQLFRFARDMLMDIASVAACFKHRVTADAFGALNNQISSPIHQSRPPVRQNARPILSANLTESQKRELS